MITARSKTVRAADHQEPRSQVFDRIVHRPQLSLVELVPRHVDKHDAVVRHQRQRIARKVERVRDGHGPVGRFECIDQRFPVFRFTFRIGDDQNFAVALNVEVIHNGVVLSQVVLARRNLDRRRVLVVTGVAQAERNLKAIHSRFEFDGSFRDLLTVLAEPQRAFAILQGGHHDRGRIVLPDFHVLRQFEGLNPDFAVVLVVDRQNVDRDFFRFEFVQNLREAAAC